MPVLTSVKRAMLSLLLVVSSVASVGAAPAVMGAQSPTALKAGDRMPAEQFAEIMRDPVFKNDGPYFVDQVKPIVDAAGREGHILQTKTFIVGDKSGPGVNVPNICAITTQAEYYTNNGTLRLNSVACSGTMRLLNITVWWYKQPIHVQNGTPSYSGASGAKTCNSGNRYCQDANGTWTVDSYRPYQTSAIFPSITVSKNDGTSETYSQNRWFYNDNGYGYPMYNDTRGNRTLIPFRWPSMGWNVCEDTARAGACSRGSSFPGQVRTRYTNNGWTIPNPGEVHHITPLQYGGTDTNLDNGVIIGPDQHSYFTYRFFTAAFRPRNF